MTKKRKVEIPKEWNRYLDIIKDEKFQRLEHQEDLSPVDKLIKLYFLFTNNNVKIKKIKLDYRNSWKIDLLLEYIKDFNEQINETPDIELQIVLARLIWLHLTIFFRDYII